MLFTTAFLALLVPALALPKVEIRQDLPDYPYDPVTFIAPVPFPAHWCARKQVTFQWNGGSGNFRFTVAPNYPGIPAGTKATVLAENTTDINWVATIPHSDIDKITYLYMVEDVEGSAYNDPDNHRFARSPALPLAQCD